MNISKSIVTTLIIFMFLISADALAETKYVSAKSLNVRSGPGSEHAVVSKLTQNQQVDVINEKDGWSKFENGWVASRFLSNVKSAQKTQAPAPAPVPERQEVKQQPTFNKTNDFLKKMFDLQGSIQEGRYYEWSYKPNSCISYIKRSKPVQPSYSDTIYWGVNNVIVNWQNVTGVYVEDESEYIHETTQDIFIRGKISTSGYGWEEDLFKDRMHKEVFDGTVNSFQIDVAHRQQERILKAMRHLHSLCKEDDPF